VSRRPAWSSAFAADALQEVTRRAPLETLTREWAWGGSTGAGVRVAVIDSGIEADHPAIGGNVSFAEVREEDGRIVVDESTHDDASGHGTACAGIIRSVAPDCDLVSVKVLGAGMRGRGPVFAAGLKWAIEHGAHVCNLSLGTTKREYYPLLHELADLAYFRSIPLVTAANNMPVPSFPSLYASVVSVASHDVEGDDLYYVNPEPPVEFGARGIDVRVPWSNGGWMTVTGNSFAAPRITGLIARLLAKHPGLAVYQVKAVLRALAANVVDGGE
jgi:subtilisin family serine protease